MLSRGQWHVGIAAEVHTSIWPILYENDLPIQPLSKIHSPSHWAAATFAQAGETLVLSVPVGEIAAVLVLALLAGIAASVLPARRAAQATPTAALAEV